MTRVDFYLLEKQTASALYPFACRLLSKAHRQNQAIFVASNTIAEAQNFNELLWTFNDISFIPHCLATDDISLVEKTPIVLGLPSELTSQVVYLNFCHELPQEIIKLERIIEIIPDEPAWRSMARKKFLEYKSQGAEIHTHKMSA